MSTSPAGAGTGGAAPVPPARAAVPAPAGGPPSASSPSSSAVMVPEELADTIAAAVLAVPGVAALHPGPYGTVATYLPGRRIAGVALRADGSAEISITALVDDALSRDLRAVAGQVTSAVAALVSGPVLVTVADLQI